MPSLHDELRREEEISPINFSELGGDRVDDAMTEEGIPAGALGRVADDRAHLGRGPVRMSSENKDRHVGP